MIESRNVSKKEISKSFRGILRVSPGEDKADTGLEEITEKVISDSIGNESTLFLGQKSASITNFTVNNLKVPSELTFNTITKVDTSVPKENEILIGDGNNNYTIKDLLEIIKNELIKYNIFASIVPVGTIFYSAMKSRDINNLPEIYRNDYLIPNGQSLSATVYPELFQVLGYTFGGSGSNFNLPNLNNKFIRSAGDAVYINDEGGYTIPNHNPGNIENPQTNSYLTKLIINNASGTFGIYNSMPQDNPPLWSKPGAAPTGCFYQTGVGGWAGNEGKNRRSQTWGQIGMNLAINIDPSLLVPRETRPYNITLVPLIKIR